MTSCLYCHGTPESHGDVMDWFGNVIGHDSTLQEAALACCAAKAVLFKINPNWMAATA